MKRETQNLGLSSYHCDACAVICQHDEDLKSHTESHIHLERSKYCCALCNFILDVGDDSNIRIHMESTKHCRRAGNGLGHKVKSEAKCEVPASDTWCVMCCFDYKKVTDLMNHERSKKHRAAVKAEVLRQGFVQGTCGLYCEICAVICPEDQSKKLHMESPSHIRREVHSCLFVVILSTMETTRVFMLTRHQKRTKR